jgi:hypothetical protein
MSTGENMILRRKANEFRIWRAGQSVGWDCTAKELASELGLHIDTIRKICSQKGWELADGHHYESVHEKREVDYYFEE